MWDSALIKRNLTLLFWRYYWLFGKYLFDSLLLFVRLAWPLVFLLALPTAVGKLAGGTTRRSPFVTRKASPQVISRSFHVLSLALVFDHSGLLSSFYVQLRFFSVLSIASLQSQWLLQISFSILSSMLCKSCQVSTLNASWSLCLFPSDLPFYLCLLTPFLLTTSSIPFFGAE